MSLLPFLAIAFGAGTAALLTRHRADVSGAIGIAGLALAALAGALAPALERLGGPLAASAPAGSAAATMAAVGGAGPFLGLGAVGGLLLVLAGAGVGTVPRSLPGGTLVTLGWAGVAFVAASPVAGVLFATAAAATSILPMLDPRAVSERGAVAAAIVLRTAVAAGLVAVGATVLVAAGPAAAGTVRPAEPMLGAGLLALAAAIAVRFGVIPLHRPAARLAGQAPAVTLPLAAIWAPAAFALVAAAGSGDAPLPLERAVIVVAALASVGLGTVALLLHDDLDHVVGYAIAIDGAIALLALATPSPATAEGLAGWLLVVAVGRTALAGWVVAVGGPAGTRRLAELAGWARRSPLLAVVLLGIGVASVGWPGSTGWEARAALVDGALDGPVGTVALGAIVAGPAIVWLRLLAAGLRRPVPGSASPAGEPAWRLRRRVATAAAAALAALAVAVASGLVGVLAT